VHLNDRVPIAGDGCMVRQRETCEPALRAEDDRDVEPPRVDSPPSPVQVLIPQSERATSLAALRTLGPKVDALSWTSQQRSRSGPW
jgi:hypothetical protein